LREEKSSRGRRSKKEQRLDSRMLEKDSPKNKWKNARAMQKCVKVEEQSLQKTHPPDPFASSSSNREN